MRSRVEELYQEFQTEMGFKPNVESPQAAEKLLRRLHAIAHAEKHPGTAPSAEAIPPSPGVLAAQTQSGSRAAAVPASEQARYEEWAGPAVN